MDNRSNILSLGVLSSVSATKDTAALLWSDMTNYFAYNCYVWHNFWDVEFNIWFLSLRQWGKRKQIMKLMNVHHTIPVDHVTYAGYLYFQNLMTRQEMRQDEDCIIKL